MPVLVNIDKGPYSHIISEKGYSMYFSGVQMVDICITRLHVLDSFVILVLIFHSRPYVLLTYRIHSYNNWFYSFVIFAAIYKFPIYRYS